MRVAYHFAIPPPPKPELDGAVQEAAWLAKSFGGSIHYLYPAPRFQRWIPQALCGVRQLSLLRALDREVDVHHLFSGSLFGYPALRGLRKPLVYTLLTSLEAPIALRAGGFWKGVAVVVVPDSRSAQLLADRGLEVETVPPGIDLERFSRQAPPADDEFVLLAGSAPWSRGQFESKGYDMLLEAVTRLPRLRLVLLWRGVLREQIERRVEARGLGARVEILHETVDVNELLGRTHAAVALARSPRLLKAFPHSLLEALAAGRPIVTSRSLAISELARQSGAGVVVERHDASSLIEALERLMLNYAALRLCAGSVDLSAFSRPAFLDAYGHIYGRVTAGAERP